MLLKGVFLVVLILISFWVQPFAFIAMVFVCAFTILERNERSLMYIFFLHGFKQYLSFHIQLWSLISIGDVIYVFIMFFVLAQYIVSVIKKERKLFIWSFALLIAFFVYTLIPFGKVSFLVSQQHFLILLLILVYALYMKSLSLRDLTIMYSVGLILTCGLGLIADLVQRIDFTKYSAYNVTRFFGLVSNPNVVYMLVLPAILSLMYLFINKKIGWQFYPLFIAVSVIGFLAVSRFFILVYPIVFVAFAIFCGFKQKKKGLISVGCVLVALCCFAAIFYPYTEASLERIGIISVPDGQQSQLSLVVLDLDFEFDPGRSGLWKYAYEDWTTSAKTIIFGNGLAAQTPYLCEHNFYLFILRRTGIVGFVLLMAFFVSLYYYANGKKWKKGLGFSLVFLAVLIANLVVEQLINQYLFAIYATIFLFVFTDEQPQRRNKFSESEIKTAVELISNENDKKKADYSTFSYSLRMNPAKPFIEM